MRVVPKLKPHLCVRVSNTNPNLSAHMPFQRSCFEPVNCYPELKPHLITVFKPVRTLHSVSDSSSITSSVLDFEQSDRQEYVTVMKPSRTSPSVSDSSINTSSVFDFENYAEYSYSELQDATNNFDESFKLGEGGFGIVYKGFILHKTKTVAIKMLKEGSSQGAKEFNQEVAILSKVRHPNLVKLIGSCADTRALIYEYLPNGSLEDRLRCKNNTSPLSWQARVRIAFEICSALSFLHGSEPHGVVHGDLKPDNILLDGNNISKICDFGLCRELNFTASASIPYYLTDCPKGTLAYMDPEYLSTGKTTPKYDVYSFGIILLLLVTCKDPRGLRNLVKDVQKKGTLKELIDASAGPWPFKEAKKLISLGLRCSDPVRKNRPDLSTKVLKELKSMLQVASSSPSSWAASLFRR